ARARGQTSLRVPTAKVGLALAAVTALAAGAGSLLGLPVPGLDGESQSRGSALTSSADAAALAFLDGGTPVGLSRGPYHPVFGDFGYGESDAKFGAPRGGRRHEGQDVFAKPGTPLVAVRDGVVVDGGAENGRYAGGRGNYVVIYSRLDDRSYVYLHMLKPALMQKGASVEVGQPLGQVGCTGSCFGPHLHFEVRVGSAGFRSETKAIDPLPFLMQWPQVPTS
ncbi:MAG: M23 family metallopeptidase, partial [Actinomycetota bacterium]|nr:M23 family metallopeptidase [Actinomycetota bacterium]